MKYALVLGAGGFIGGHLARRLKEEGYWVRGVDLKENIFFSTRYVDEFFTVDLRKCEAVTRIMWGPEQHEVQNNLGAFDEVYQLAADMGGAGYIFSREHDADIMHNSALINLHVARAAADLHVKKVFYSSSACIYPDYLQMSPCSEDLEETAAYPANPDSCYGWEKLFSEQLYQAFSRNYALDVRIARFHNVMGPFGAYCGGKEKAPAAICRKVAEAREGDYIEIWGDGAQTRSFLPVDECVEGIRRLMDSDFAGPVNIGSDRMLSIDELTRMIIEISGKKLTIKHLMDKPTGVRGRNSNNALIREKLTWAPSQPLAEALTTLYQWINDQVHGN